MLQAMNETPDERSEPVATAAPRHPRRLVRRTHDKVLAGVAGGLGDYFRIDPVWFRLGFVLTALLAGGGIIVYLLLWAAMPTEGEERRTALERQAERIAYSLRGTPPWVGITLLVVGGLLAVTQAIAWRPGVFWGLALVVLGVLLFRQAGTPSADVREPLVEPLSRTFEEPAAPPGSLPLPAAPPPPRARRERSRLGWFTIGVLLVMLGIAATLDLADVLRITLVQYLALALSVLGIGLLVGTWMGRARWLVVPCTLLIPFVLTASLIEVPFTGRSGDLYYNPTSAQAVEREYNMVAGRLLLDLRNLKQGAEPIPIRLTAVAGVIEILVPEGTPMEIRARVGAGHIELFGRSYDGVKVDVRRTFPGAKPEAPVMIRIDAETSLGAVHVRSCCEEPS
jgi:phage shock protein PspC (stress-responsive transcriptional regulator)